VLVLAITSFSDHQKIVGISDGINNLLEHLPLPKEYIFGIRGGMSNLMEML